MSDYSRVKKYENLRNDIEHDKEGNAHLGDALNAYNKTVNEEPKETYVPSHEKTFTSQNKVETEATQPFKNEYLDSFIQEVREYNMQKGIRENEDTKLDILQQLTTKNREKRANYIERIEEPSTNPAVMVEDVFEKEPILPTFEKTNVDETMEISKQVFALLNDEPTVEEEKEVETPVVATPVAPLEEKQELESDSELEKRIAALERKMVVPEVIDEVDDEEISQIAKHDLLEETMKLKIKMEEYEEELSEINSGVDSNNRLLNIIIIVLIVALLAVIGVVVYWLIAGGVL